MSDAEASGIGRVLRSLRAARGMSQMALALEADISTRHISFIETGKSHPSRVYLSQIADALQLPLRERNMLFEVGGYARVYPDPDLDRMIVERAGPIFQSLLENLEPFPAIVIDRHWDILMENRAMPRVLSLFLDVESLWSQVEPNFMRLILHPDGLRQVQIDWDAAAQIAINRLLRAIETYGNAPKLGALKQELCSYPGVPTRMQRLDIDPVPTLIPYRLKNRDLDISFYVSIITLGSTDDVALQGVRVECFCPADAQSRRILEQLAAQLEG